MINTRIRTYGVLMYPYGQVSPNICRILGGGTKGGRIKFEFSHFDPFPTQLPYWDSWDLPDLIRSAARERPGAYTVIPINFDGKGRVGGLSYQKSASVRFF